MVRADETHATRPAGDAATAAAVRRLVDGFNPKALPPSFYADPFPTYHALRRASPVHRCPDGSVYLTRYDDIAQVYRDPHRFSSDKHRQFAPAFGAGSLLFEHHTTSLVFNDPPLHTHVRKAFGNALSPKAIVAMAPSVQRLVDGLLDDLAEQGEFDLVEDYAAAIPIEVIGNLLRVPHDERGPFRRWSLGILGALELGVTPEQVADGNRCVAEMLDYLAEFVARRRSSLTDDDDDLLARLIRWESDGFRLTERQLFHQCIFLLNAGHETTSNLIGNGVHALLTHPDQRDRLRDNPGLIDSAVEEILRYESPNQLGNRTTTESVAIGGAEVPAQTVLTLCIGAANRDPAQFPDPDRFDLARSPNKHLAFGAGIHTCAGLNVARLEGRIAIAGLLQRFPRLALAGEPVRSQRARFRGFVSVPMVTDKADY